MQFSLRTLFIVLTVGLCLWAAVVDRVEPRSDSIADGYVVKTRIRWHFHFLRLRDSGNRPWRGGVRRDFVPGLDGREGLRTVCLENPPTGSQIWIRWGGSTVLTTNRGRMLEELFILHAPLFVVGLVLLVAGCGVRLAFKMPSRENLAATLTFWGGVVLAICWLLSLVCGA